jgi:hypothetical protein
MAVEYFIGSSQGDGVALVKGLPYSPTFRRGNGLRSIRLHQAGCLDGNG